VPVGVGVGVAVGVGVGVGVSVIVTVGVEVGVLVGTRLYIDASSTSGDVRSELDVGNEPASDGPEAQLRVKTVSGDIALVRTVRLGAS